MDTEPDLACEACGAKCEVDFTMPTGAGIFTADLCLSCSMSIHEDKDTLMRIIRQRAKDRNVALPVPSVEALSKLLLKKEKS